ncbi:MAG: chemotaxis protein CheB [Arenimonas sp.]
MTDAVRVALLARAGQARDQLRRALEESGAQIVAEGDPGELDPRDVSEKMPNVFLVSLEPAIEKSLDRFESMFAREGVEVMFDDAETTSKLDGWDLNRWARHLVGKLLGSAILPPAPEGAAGIGESHDDVADAGMVLRPGLPPTPAELMDDAKLEDYTSESPELADWVPTSPSLTAPAPDDEPLAEPDLAFSWDGSEATVGDGSAGEGEVKEFRLDTDLGIDIDLASLDFAPVHEAPPPASTLSLEDEPIFQEMEMGEGMRFSSFSEEATSQETVGDLDADVAALAAQLEAFEKSDTRGAAVDPAFARQSASDADAAFDAAPPAPPPRGAPKVLKPAARPAGLPAETAGGKFDFSNLSLSSLESELQAAPPIEVKFAEASAENSAAAELESTLTLMPLAGAGESGLGAALILAGLGGPDAVRQLLSSLPEALAVPVLLYQHLEVGKHERLVEQLAKISKLPVVLAKLGEVPEAGKVTLLPAGMTAIADGEALRFAPGSLSQLISALPPNQSMIIVLSGADVALVPMILAVKEEGGLVLAQDPEVCFDPAAAEAMRREGAAVYPALGLARQVAARWPL